MPDRIEKYLRNADECRLEATRAGNRREKAGYLKIAQQWEKMAKRRAKEQRDIEPEEERENRADGL
jgi:hypothetical protein